MRDDNPEETNDKGVTAWMRLATIGAFSALGLVGFSYWIGVETIFQCIMVILTTTFFVVAIIWWYWALKRIAGFTLFMNHLSKSLKELSQAIKDIRKDL